MKDITTEEKLKAIPKISWKEYTNIIGAFQNNIVLSPREKDKAGRIIITENDMDSILQYINEIIDKKIEKMFE